MKRVRYLPLVPLVLKQLLRHPLKTLLTLSGVAVAMFLFCSVQAMHAGVEAATQVTAEDTTLIVYRENRYCPFTSQLPQYYQGRIEAIDGVASAVPVRIEVSNCRASLDVVTFRGVPEAPFGEHFAPRFEWLGGSLDAWRKRSDSAILGESLALRRGFSVGDRFSAAGITVSVAGIIRSDEPQDQNVAYTHLSFIQEASQRGGTGGVVTQFNVQVTDSTRLDSIAQRIDEEFAHDSAPTSTRPEKAFVAHAASDLLELVKFAAWLGWGALAAVFGLVANSIILAVHDRVREYAILQTLGYQQAHISLLILLEACLLGLLGGGVGALGALLFTQQRYSMATEGLNIEVASAPGVIVIGLGLSVLLGLVAGVIPAWRTARREITESFRAN